MKNIIDFNEDIFESIKNINEYGQEYWSARVLYKVLEYTEYNKFKPAISRAMKACENSGNIVTDHFAQVSEMIKATEMTNYNVEQKDLLGENPKTIRK